MTEPTPKVFTYDELLSALLGFWAFLRRSWYIVLLGVIAFGSYGAYKALSKPRMYPAKIRFMVNEDQGSGGGRMTAVLSSFGLGGLGGGMEKANPEKILSIATSSLVVLPALDSLVLPKGQADNKKLITAVLDAYPWMEKWQSGGFVSDTTAVRQALTGGGLRRLNGEPGWVLQKVFGALKGQDGQTAMVSTVFDKTTGIMSLSAKTVDPNLSAGLLTAIFSRLTSYYVEKTVEPQRAAFAKIAYKTDSLRRNMSRVSDAIAGVTDTRQAIPGSRSKIRREELVRDLQIMTVAYTKALENREMAEFSLQSQTPFLQVIDEPLYPIEAEPRGVVKAVIPYAIGGFLLSFLLVLILYIRS